LPAGITGAHSQEQDLIKNSKRRRQEILQAFKNGTGPSAVATSPRLNQPRGLLSKRAGRAHEKPFEKKWNCLPHYAK